MLKSSKFILLSILVTGLLSQCDTSKKYNEEEASEAKTEDAAILRFTTKTIEQKQEKCINDECTMVSVSYPEVTNTSGVAKDINEELESRVNQMTQDLIPPGAGTGKNIKQNMKAFIDSYEEFKKAFPEVQTPWTVDINIESSFQNSTFVSFMVETQSYTGGAHPNSSVSFINLDNQAKPIKTLSYFVSDMNKLKQIAEAAFRKQKSLTTGQALSEAGFMFDDDQFTLPGSFGFSSKGLILYYNSYEIASYADGPTELVISFNELTDIIKF